MNNMKNVLAIGYIVLSIVSPPIASSLYVYSECANRNATLSHMTKSIVGTFVVCSFLCLFMWLPGIVYTWHIIFTDQKSAYVPYWNGDQLLSLSSIRAAKNPKQLTKSSSATA